MPKCFKFTDTYINDDDDEVDVGFECKLESSQCGAETKTGAPCKKNSVIGLPFCYVHSKSYLKLEIRDSDIEGAGKGVFAFNPHANHGRVFSRSEFICEYVGEVLTAEEVDERYGATHDLTAPYTIRVSANRFLDAACRRGIAGVINHSVTPNVRFYTYQGRVRCKAIRNINHGTELKANYYAGYQFQDNHRTYNCKK
jgi:hypothetical protein